MLLLSAAALLSAAPIEAPASAQVWATPQRETVVFISAPDGPLWALVARLEARTTATPELSYSYHVELFQGDAPTPADTVLASPSGQRQLVRDTSFTSRPPLEGWPERDTLSLEWHDDGALEVCAGGAVRLLTAGHTPHLAPGDRREGVMIGVAEAELRIDGERRAGMAIVEIAPQTSTRSLISGGAVFLVTSAGQRALWERQDRRWWQLAHSAPLRADPRSLPLIWREPVDETTPPGALVLERGAVSLGLERLDDASAADGSTRSESARVEFVPFAGGGFYGENRAVTAVGLWW